MDFFASIATVWVIFLVASIDMPKVPQGSARTQKRFLKVLFQLRLIVYHGFVPSAQGGSAIR